MLIASRRVCCLALAALVIAAPQAPAQLATVVATRGQAAPETGNNQFSQFERPSINLFGQVAFQGIMSSSTDTTTPTPTGIFLTLPPTQPISNLITPQLPGSNLNGMLSEVGLFAGPLAGALQDPATGNPLVGFFNGFGNEVALNNTPVNVNLTATIGFGTSSMNYSVTGSGQIAFMADVSQASQVSLTGVFAGRPQRPTNMVNVAVGGSSVPASPFGAANPYSSIDAVPAQNDMGVVAYAATLTSGDFGFFANQLTTSPGGGTTQTAPATIVLSGQAALTAIGKNGVFTGFGNSRAIGLNNHNNVAYYGTTDNPTFPTGLFGETSSGGSKVPLALVEKNGTIFGTTAASTAPNGGVWLSVAGPAATNDAFSISDNNLVAFQGSFIDPQLVSLGTGVADSGIFTVPVTGGAFVVVARTRQTPSPLGMPNGILIGPNPAKPYSLLYPKGTYPNTYPPDYAGKTVDWVTFNDFIAQNKTGWLSYTSGLAPGVGGGVFVFSSSGSAANSVTAVALSGNPAPGAGPGVTYSGLPNVALAMNNHNLGDGGTGLGPPEIVFTANLAGNGVVTGQNDVALFIANGRMTTDQFVRETAMIARTGDQIPIGRGQFATITSFTAASGMAGYLPSIGNGRNSLNDVGQFATVVNYVFPTGGGGSGVYVFTPDLRLRDNTSSNPFGPTGSVTPIAGPSLTVAWNNPNTNISPLPFGPWSFSYNPGDGIYKVVVDPLDATDKSGASVPVTDVTVTGFGQGIPSLPALTVGGVTGRAHVQLAAATVTIGVEGVSDGYTVLTMRSGTGGVGMSDITGASGTIALKGDVRSLTGATTANIAVGVDIGNVPLTNVDATGTLTPAPPSNQDIDRFRVFNVDRGNFVGTNPIDLLISGQITSLSETNPISANSNLPPPPGIVFTNNVHRGIWKTGAGTLRLTGDNMFGPLTDPTTATQVITPPGGTMTTVTDTYATSPFVESIRVTGGLLSFGVDTTTATSLPDGNLGTLPTPAGTTKPRWIVLDGGGLQFAPTMPATLAIDPHRGISLGPISGTGNGIFDVATGSTLTYAGIVADNTGPDPNSVFGVVTTGVGSLTKNNFGTLVLSGMNTYRGGTIVNQGTLVVPADTALGADGTPVTVNTAGTLLYSGSTTTNRVFTLNGGILAAAAGVTVTLGPPAAIYGGHLVGGGFTLAGSNTLVNVSQEGVLNVAASPAPPAPANTVNLINVINQGSGSITVGANSVVNAVNFQSYGVLNLLPGTAPATGGITLMTNTGSTPLFFNGGSRTFLSIPPNGSAGLFDAGIDLFGKNAVVAGGLFENDGFVVDSFGAGTATVIADFGSLVRGTGFFQNPVQTVNGGRFKAGLCPGLATFGSFKFGPGGVDNYLLYIDNATGTAGPSPDANSQVRGWGLVKSIKTLAGGKTTPGDFSWTADPNHLLTVHLDTLLNPTTIGDNIAGPMANFDPSQPYSWVAASWAGNYTGPTDPSSLLASTNFDTSGFLNPIAGTFGWNLDLSDRMLSLTYTPGAVPEPGTLALVGAVAAGGWLLRRRRTTKG
jgi:autotransporter-associated beta strand protein